MRYTGVLGKGITAKPIGFLSDADAARREAERQTDEMFKKLPELFRVHGVETGDWPGLALALAKEHVPGFRLRRQAGRKTEWSIVDKAEFRVDVDEIIAQDNSKLSVTEAIKIVIRREAWQAKTKSMTMGAIKKQYENALPAMIKVVQKARAYEKIAQRN